MSEDLQKDFNLANEELQKAMIELRSLEELRNQKVSQIHEINGKVKYLRSKLTEEPVEEEVTEEKEGDKENFERGVEYPPDKEE
jgi:predicted  nucleic acid-binding Zn-ribbon protein